MFAHLASFSIPLWSALVMVLLAAVIASLLATYVAKMRRKRAHTLLFTAKTADEDHIQGLQAEADAYPCKPFNPSSLISNPSSLISNPSSLISNPSSLIPNPVTEQSDQFIDRMHEAILRLMPQGNMDVDSIAAELCLSPSQLRRKMNAVTGMPPKKFIMKVRMDAASEMMQQHPDMKLSDIAEKCGFYDLSHFIHLYKETYGTTPAADHRK